MVRTAMKLLLEQPDVSERRHELEMSALNRYVSNIEMLLLQITDGINLKAAKSIIEETMKDHKTANWRLRSGVVLGILAITALGQAQTPQTPQAARPNSGAQTGARQGAQTPAFPDAPANYVLNSGDQVIIKAFELDEISNVPTRIDPDGTINLPLLGRVGAAGMTVLELEAELVQRAMKHVRSPQVTVAVAQFRTFPVVVTGAFASPGVYQLHGAKTLSAVFTEAGGLAPHASRRVRLKRKAEHGSIPLRGASRNDDTGVSTAEIALASGSEMPVSADDIALKPDDVISVDRAEMIFVSGEVGRVGGIEIGGRESLSVMQAISMAGGFGRDASSQQAKVLRPVLNTARRAEIPVNLDKIRKGEANDFPLQPNDILFVPRSSRLQIWTRVGVVSLAVITTAALVLR